MLVGKNGLENKIKNQVDDFLTDLKAYENTPFKIRPMIARSVSNVVGSLLMSMTFDNKDDKEFLRLLQLIDEGFKLFSVAMPVNFIPIFRYIPGFSYAYQKLRMNRDETSSFFKNIADDHRKSLDSDNIRDIVDAYLVQQDKASKEKKENFFSEAQLIQIMNDLFSAGLETVTSTIEWSVLFLMKHPEIQAKVYEEVQTVIGDERTPQLDDLPSMPYTEATMYEVLRRSNVIPLGNTHATLEWVFNLHYFQIFFFGVRERERDSPSNQILIFLAVSFGCFVLFSGCKKKKKMKKKGETGREIWLLMNVNQK